MRWLQIASLLKRLFSLFLLVLGMNSTFVMGQDETLTPFQQRILAKNLDDYFGPEAVRRTAESELHALKPWLPAIFYVVQELRGRLESPNLDDDAGKRAGQLLQIIALKVERISPQISDQWRKMISQSLQFFLQRYESDPNVMSSVLRIYDYWQLWGPEEFSLVRSWLETHDGLHLHSQRLSQIINRLSAIQQQAMAKYLRRYTRELEFAGFLLLATNQMTDLELFYLFNQVSEGFAKTLRFSAMIDDQSFFELRSTEPRQIFAAKKLSDLMHAFENGDALVVSALHKAEAVAKYTWPKDYLKSDRLLFFELFKTGRLDWFDRRHWISAEQKSLLDIVQVKKNILQVDFAARRNCSDDL
jgi:hypothetical protein